MIDCQLIKTEKGDFYSVVAPEKLCFLSNPEVCIKFFNKVESIFRNNDNVIYDFSRCLFISLESIAIIISQLKDRNINNGRLVRVDFPKDEDCNRILRGWGIFKKVDNVFDASDFEHIPAAKISDTKVMNELSRDFVKFVTEAIYGEEVRVRELYEILIECMANTNNHASVKGDVIYGWWLCSFYLPEEDCVAVVFLDLGVGIFDSLPVKQFMIRSPLPVHTQAHTKRSFVRGKELSHIYTCLVNGKIKSSTGLPNRGRGVTIDRPECKIRSL